MSRNVILSVVTRFLIPYVLLFGLYVQFHGELGPGGAFQAGVIVASAFIVHALVFGVEVTRRIAPPAVLQVIAALGVLVYAGTGVASLLLGGAFLDYDLLGPSPTAGQHAGIILVELGVGLTVSSVMMLIYFKFASWELHE